jgi:lipoprotein-anchoring transpeptidase ErfK/SrfK
MIAMLGGLAVLAGCNASGGASWKPSGAQAATKAADFSVSTPADGATKVPTATEIALTGADAAAATVTLADAKGATVQGAMRAEGTAWVPTTQLAYATTYTATVTSKGQSKKVSFTTMDKPGKLARVSIPLSDNQVYGVGLPIVVTFASDVPADQRANVERRLFVTSEPAQVGAWNWFNGHEVHFRPKEYWQVGTKLSVRLAVGGLFLGGTSYGAKDVTLNATIGDKIVMTTENSTHTMTVTQNDQVIKTIPISLGKPSTPSSSGNMVVITKNPSELFVSTTPGDSYRETVYWTQRLTWSGQYIHAAPWSVDSQGKNNVSHGCTNMSTENAKWLYGLTHVGDPVIVHGTPRKLDWGNGWTDWDRTWDEYLKGSALPAPADTATTTDAGLSG